MLDVRDGRALLGKGLLLDLHRERGAETAGHVEEQDDAPLGPLKESVVQVQPFAPNSVIASTGPSTAPNQCGVHVENSTASSGLMVKFFSPRMSLSRPESM